MAMACGLDSTPYCRSSKRAAALPSSRVAAVARALMAPACQLILTKHPIGQPGGPTGYGFCSWSYRIHTQWGASGRAMAKFAGYATFVSRLSRVVGDGRVPIPAALRDDALDQGALQAVGGGNVGLAGRQHVGVQE